MTGGGVLKAYCAACIYVSLYGCNLDKLFKTTVFDGPSIEMKFLRIQSASKTIDLTISNVAC